MLADDLINGYCGGAVDQMVNLFQECQSSILCVEQVPQSETGKYGIVQINTADGGAENITSIVEKPCPDQASSNLAVIGRYLLTPRIFHFLERTSSGSGGEIQLTDAIAKLLGEEKVLAYRFKGKRYDCGDKLGYLQATVEFALKHPELKEGFRAFLQKNEW